MNVNLQKCNVCGAFNTEGKKDWVRINGASNDPARPAQHVIDVCGSCAPTTTVDKLPGLVPQVVRPTASPILRSPPLATLPVDATILPPPSNANPS